MNYASGAIAVSRALDQLIRRDRGRLLSALMAQFRDLQLAEDALQDALESAVAHWTRTGLPDSPSHWLIRVASRKAIDRIRRQKTAIKLGDEMAQRLGAEIAVPEGEDIPDERLRLMLICCHPALERKSQIALTLRTIAGLPTAEIARCFLDNEATMGQRLSRSKAKMAAARIPFVLPEPEEWPDRIQAVLGVIYLIFTAGHGAGPVAGTDLAAEALFLARLLNQLWRDDPEIEGCLALILLTHARRNARISPEGVSVSITQQNRALWNRQEFEEGEALLEKALMRSRPGPYQIKAAIAACHHIGGGSDWPQIAALYHQLLRFEPTPVVRLNLAVAIAETGAVDAALAMLAQLRPALEMYQPFHAARADLFMRSAQSDQARAAYETAIALAVSDGDRAFLRERLAHLPQPATAAAGSDQAAAFKT